MPDQKTTIERVCMYCGKEFSYESTNPRPGKFCSWACRNRYRARPFVERFWEKVQKTESCWLWTGQTNNKGYGWIWTDAPQPLGRKRLAHRISWELQNGSVPNGLYVLHNCPGGDNPLCVNPAHLFLGTAGDNARDAKAKGRNACGERHSGSKLIAEQVLRIRARLAAGDKPGSIAKDYGVSEACIRHIDSRTSWAHL